MPAGLPREGDCASLRTVQSAASEQQSRLTLASPQKAWSPGHRPWHDGGFDAQSEAIVSAGCSFERGCLTGKRANCVCGGEGGCYHGAFYSFNVLYLNSWVSRVG